MRSRGFVVRPFVTTDEGSWLRCRALAFLQTDYFDDVVPSKPTSDLPPLELVAVEDDNDGDVVGLLSVIEPPKTSAATWASAVQPACESSAV